MNEAQFTRSIMKALPTEIYKWKIMNVMQNGVPDAYFSGPAGDLWIEFKYIKAPKRSTTKIEPNLSPLQYKWIIERSKEGRNVAVIIGSDIGCYIYKSYNNKLKQVLQQIINRNFLILTKKDIVKWITTQTLG